tara:strand:- start:130 stop:747 length:618 start_codon:yes stop_codon:yes gene_type:complete
MFKTEQESFWAGDFGDKYIDRNTEKKLLASNINFFARALGRASSLNSCLEFGANIGINLKALKFLVPEIQTSAVEINSKAADELRKFIPQERVFNNSVIDFNPTIKTDLVLSKGVLIHINPKFLRAVYEKLYLASKKYILLCEYYNSSPIEVEYRGYQDKLFKRDFAGDILDMFNDLELVDYGFLYHRDLNFPQDDLSWFLLKKK